MTRIVDITVAIATLDRPDDLSRCLEAIMTGVNLPSEVIVVDQGETSSTIEIIKTWQQVDVPIIHVRQKQRGLSASRNSAIAHAHAPVIAFTDDDCVPDAGWVASIDRTFASTPGLAVTTGRVLPLGPSEPGTFSVSPREGYTAIDFKGKAIPWLVGTGGNMAVRRQWFERIGCFDERLGAGTYGRAAEDADMLYRLLSAGACVRYEPASVVNHRRQTREQRLASRRNYGHGIGAFCAIWLRHGDVYVLRILGYWILALTRELAASIAHRDIWEIRQRLLSLQGTARGLAYGLALPTASREKNEFRRIS